MVKTPLEITKQRIRELGLKITIGMLWEDVLDVCLDEIERLRKELKDVQSKISDG